MCRVTCYNLPYKRHRVTVVGYSLTLFLVSKFFRKSDFNNNGSLNNLITLSMGNKKQILHSDWLSKQARWAPTRNKVHRTDL